MTLTTHAIVGAAVAQFFPGHPVAAFVAGFLSHLCLDSLPHRDYDLVSLKKDNRNRLKDGFIYNKLFAFDLAKILLDFAIGLALVYAVYLYLAGPTIWIYTLAGVIGGVLPDALQFVYFNFRREPLTSLQKFHTKIQNEVKSYFWGIISQLVVIVLTLAAVAILIH
jgi:hypothetical protein